MDLLTRTIGLFSPRAAANRQAHRMRLTYLSALERRDGRNYDGASRTKRNKDWNPSRGSADSILGPAVEVLRARAYDLTRNNPHGAAIPSRHADNMVGTGIAVKFKTGNEATDKVIKDLWNEFTKAKNFDPGGDLTFEAATYKMAWNMVAGGEMYARRRDRRASDGLKIPIQVQLLEADMVDWNKQSAQASRIRNVVVQGVEFDAIGRKVGYWMFQESPNSKQASFYTPRESKLVSSDEIAHLFEGRRNQVHGETWLAPVMNDLRDLQDYKITELVRKKTEACMVGVISPAEDSEDDEGPMIGVPDQDRFDPETGELLESADWGMTDIEGDPVERFEPGMFYQTKPGATVSWNTPATSAGYDTYMRTQLRDIAAGARMPYEVLTGDLSEVSFASGKMGVLDYRRFVESVQWNQIIPLFCQRVADWFLDAAEGEGLIPPNLKVEVEWTPPAFQSITPIDDVNTDLMEVRAGFASWDSKIRARGQDPDAVAAEIVARNKFFDEKEVILDSDPRYVAKNGQKHIVPNDGSAEGATNAPGEQGREQAGQDGRRKPRRAGRKPR